MFPNGAAPSAAVPDVPVRSTPRVLGAALSACGITAHAAELPSSADMLGLRDRGAARARGAAGRLAHGPAYRALPSLRHQRARPGSDARGCAAPAGLMIAACRIGASAFGAAPGAGGPSAAGCSRYGSAKEAMQSARRQRSRAWTPVAAGTDRQRRLCRVRGAGGRGHGHWLPPVWIGGGGAGRER